jgi:hypothetical protein
MLVAAPASAQTHARHTAAHDSAHAIVLSDADHLALHELLLGRWTGGLAAGGAMHRDTLEVRFENDSLHQQLMVRHQHGVTGFQIRGDTLSWMQPIGGAHCVASTPVSALVQLAKSKTATRQMAGNAVCGETRSAFTLRKLGS